MTILGIDPGLSGGVAILHPSGDIELFDTPSVNVVKQSGKSKRMYDTQLMTEIIKSCTNGGFKNRLQAVIEQVNAMPGQGVTSMFSMGYGFGLWIGIIATLGIPINYVHPRIWKKEFSLSKDKNLSILRAKELFPRANITLKKHEGRAEALLMAEWFRRKQNPPIPHSLPPTL